MKPTGSGEPNEKGKLRKMPVHGGITLRKKFDGGPRGGNNSSVLNPDNGR